jgi:diguanylate cyclase (GGDEF)-like protein
LFSVSRLKNVEQRLSVHHAYGLAVLAVIATHFISENVPSLGIQYPEIYLAVLFFSGLLGTFTSWVIPFILFVFDIILLNISSDISINSKELTMPLLSQSIVSLLFLLGSGLFPALIMRQYRVLKGSLDKKSIETSSTETVTAESVQSSKPEANPISTLTQTFTIDELQQNADGNVRELLASVVFFMSRNFKAHSALGFTYDPVSQSFVLNSYQSKSGLIFKGISIPLGKGIIGKVGSEKRPFMSGELSYYNEEICYYTSVVPINSLLVMPVISEQNELLGALVLDSLDKRTFLDQDRETLKRFSVLAAALITNARMRILQEQAAHMFQIFYQASHHFTTAMSIEDVYKVLFSMVPLITKCSRQIAVTFDESQNSGRVLNVVSTNQNIKPGFVFPINSGLYSYVHLKAKMVYFSDYRTCQSRYYRFVPDEIKDSSTRSLIIFPIIDDKSRCRGIFSIESDEPDQFANEKQQILATLMENASVAMTRAVLYKRMELLATTDGLTGLNNHRNFQEILTNEIERARRYKRPLSLLLMDIDHFKTFNDTYGHPVGDLVLKEISACIRRSIRFNDIPARYGGEEFTVIIPETSGEGAMITAERIRQTIESHIIRSNDKELRVNVSIGCANYPIQVSSQQELIDCADKALYYSKEHGRNCVTLYRPEMSVEKKEKGH